MYMLGFVDMKLGELAKAEPLLTRAYALYGQDGFIPEGPRAAFAEIKRRVKAQKREPQG